MIHINIFIGYVTEISTMDAANGQGCSFVEHLMIVGVVIAKEDAAIHKTNILIERAMILRSYTHGAVAIIPQLHTTESNVSGRRTLSRLSAIKPFDGNGIIVGSDESIEEVPHRPIRP